MYLSVTATTEKGDAKPTDEPTTTTGKRPYNRQNNKKLQKIHLINYSCYNKNNKNNNT